MSRSVNNKIYLLVFFAVSFFAVYVQINYCAKERIDIQKIPDLLKIEMLETISSYGWISYLFAPVLILVRIFYTAVCFFLGGLFSDDMERKKFSDCLGIAIKGDCVYCLYTLAITVSFLTIGYAATVDLCKSMSLLVFFDYESIGEWLMSLLVLFNITELIYWIGLTCIVARTGCGFKKAIDIVVSSYGLGFVFYVIALLFIVLYVVS